MRTESLEDSYLALSNGAGPHPGEVVIHEASGLNDHIRDVCRRFADHGYAALGIDLFGRKRSSSSANLVLSNVVPDLTNGEMGPLVALPADMTSKTSANADVRKPDVDDVEASSVIVATQRSAAPV